MAESARGAAGAMRGLVLAFLWVYTIVAGFYALYAPALLLAALDHSLYRLVTDQLFALWQLYPVALFGWLFDTQTHLYGDPIRADETCIIIMNHRTRVDWNYAWIALYHAEGTTVSAGAGAQHALQTTNNNSIYSKLKTYFGKKAKLKHVLKDEIKYIPGIGWIMQLNHFLYLKRDWSEDERSMRQWLDYYRRLSCKLQILLFPEGTDLSKENRMASDRYAAAHNEQAYDFVLHPRTRGFAALCSRLRDAGLDSVYDVTLAYDAPPDSELSLACGDYPRHVYAHIKRIGVSELPRGQERLRRWLAERWRHKETSLRNFHNHGAFLEGARGAEPAQLRARSPAHAQLAFLFWTALDVAFLLALARSTCFQLWVAYNTILFIFVTWRFGGFHNLQNTLFQHPHC